METATQNFNFFELLRNAGGVDYVSLVETLTQGLEENSEGYDGLFDEEMIFKQYETWEDSFAVIKDVMDRAEAGERLPSWLKLASNIFRSRFGNISLEDFNQKMDEQTTQVKKLSEVTDSLLLNIKEIINLGGQFEKDRLEITDDKKGIFDFSLASQGLYRPVEFFSDPYTKRKGENEFAYLGEPEGVIPPDRVFKDQSKAGLTIYYFVSEDGKKYTCERRQKGTTDVFNNLSNECFLGQDSQGLVLPYNRQNPEKVFNGARPHRLKYASSSKKVYLKFKRKEASTKFVDIFIPLNWLGTSDANKALNVFTPVMVAATLEAFDIKTRISVVRNGLVENDIFETISIPLKNYDEPAVEKIPRIINLMANSENAGAFFGFHLINSANNGEQIGKNGKPIISGHKQISLNPYYDNKGAIVNLFMRYKNWIKFNEGKPWVNTKVINPNFQIFTHVSVAGYMGEPFYQSPPELTPEVISESMPYIMYQFYWYMDYLAIEFVPMEEFISNIYRRIEEDRVFKKLFNVPERKELNKTMYAYINNILVYKYFTSDGGDFADTPEQSKEKIERRKELRIRMDETIKKFGGIEE